jgi:predicted MFS family arabinose efflux permease
MPPSVSEPEPPADLSMKDPAAVSPGYLAGGGQMVGTTAPAELVLTGWRRAVAALHYRSYRYLWAGALLSNVGSWMQNVARDWLVYQLGGASGKFWLGLNALAEGLPLVLLLPLGGVLADRFSRRTILITVSVISALLAVGLAVLTVSGHLRGWHIVAFTAAVAAMDALRIPANQSLLPDLVGRDDVPNAIALNSMQFNLSRVTGPALGGLALVTLGPAWSFSLNALSFSGVIIAVLLMRNLPVRAPRRESLRRTMGQGVAYIRSRADLMTMMLLVVVGGTLAAPVTKMLPALSRDFYGRDEAGFAVLLSCFGIGAVLGAALLAVRSHRDPTPWRAFPILMGLGVCQIAIAFNGVYEIGLLLVGLAGLLFIGAMVRLNTAVLHSTPAQVRGRVAGFQALAFRIGVPVGGLLAGWIGQTLGLMWAFLGFGLAMLVIVPALLLMARQRKVRYAGGWADED